MAFVAAATSVGAAVLGTGAAAGIGSTLVGGALIGAGVGGLYSGITGDGNILNSMLTGGLIGAAGAGLGSAMGLGGAKTAAGAQGLSPAAAAAAPSTAAAPTANVMTVTPAMKAAALESAAVAEGATTAGMVPAANTGLAANTVLPASMKFTPPATAAAGSGLTGKQMLGYGLAGSAALSLLGSRQGQKIPTQPGSPSYIRPYTYSSSINQPTGLYPNPYATTQYDAMGNPVLDTRERNYFDQSYEAEPIYQAAKGGLMAAGGPVERMSSMDQKAGMYPMGMMDRTYYATPTQRPASMEVIKSDYDTPVNPMTGLPPIRMNEGGSLDEYIKNEIINKARSSAPSYTYDAAKQQYSQAAPALDPSQIPAGFNPLVVQAYQAQNPNAFKYDAATQRYSGAIPSREQYDAYLSGIQSDYDRSRNPFGPFGMFGLLSPFGFGGFDGYAAGGQTGGEYNLGSYSDGGRLLKGPGDGMSDHIPAMIGKKQPARLADGEFVVPADVVSHLGNGSTDAGAKRLYAMMDKVRKARTGNKKQGKEIKAEKFIPV